MLRRTLLPCLLLAGCDRAPPEDASARARLDAAEARIAALERRLAEAPAATSSPAVAVVPEFAPQLTSSGRPVRVRVETAAIVVDGETIADADLAATFARLAAAGSDRSVMLQAAPSVPHARLVEVMEQAKAAGLTRYAIVTDAEPSAPTAR